MSNMSEEEQVSEMDMIIEGFKKNFKQIFTGMITDLAHVFQNAKDDVLDYETFDEFKRKFIINFLKELSFMLKNHQLKHQDFRHWKRSKPDLRKPR